MAERERDRKGKAEVEVLQPLLSPLSCQAGLSDVTLHANTNELTVGDGSRCFVPSIRSQVAGDTGLCATGNSVTVKDN